MKIEMDEMEDKYVDSPFFFEILCLKLLSLVFSRFFN